MERSFGSGFSDEDSDIEELIGSIETNDPYMNSREDMTIIKESQSTKNSQKISFLDKNRSITTKKTQKCFEAPSTLSQDSCFLAPRSVSSKNTLEQKITQEKGGCNEEITVLKTETENPRWKSNFPGPAGVMSKSIQRSVPELQKWKNFRMPETKISTQLPNTQASIGDNFWSKIKTKLEPEILAFIRINNISSILDQINMKRMKLPWLVGYVVAEEYICGKDGRIVLKDDSSAEITAFCHRDVIEAYSHYFQHGGVLLLKNVTVLRTHVILNSWNFVRIYALNNEQEIDVKELQTINVQDIIIPETNKQSVEQEISSKDVSLTVASQKGQPDFFNDDNFDEFNMLTDEEFIAASMATDSKSISKVQNKEIKATSNVVTELHNSTNSKNIPLKFNFKAKTSPAKIKDQADISKVFDDDDFERMVQDLDMNSFSKEKDSSITQNQKARTITFSTAKSQVSSQTQIKKETLNVSVIESIPDKKTNKFSFKNFNKAKNSKDTTKKVQDFQISEKNDSSRKRDRKSATEMSVSESFKKKIDSHLSPFKKKKREDKSIEKPFSFKKPVTQSPKKTTEIKTELFSDDKLDDLMAEGNLDDWLNT